jgi:aldose 1-epimerase
LKVFSNQPGLEVYTAGYLSEMEGKNGAKYAPFGGFCLMTQKYSGSVNWEFPGHPRPFLRPGEIYKHKAVYEVGLM